MNALDDQLRKASTVTAKKHELLVDPMLPWKVGLPEAKQKELSTQNIKNVQAFHFEK